MPLKFCSRPGCTTVVDDEHRWCHAHALDAPLRAASARRIERQGRREKRAKASK